MAERVPPRTVTTTSSRGQGAARSRSPIHRFLESRATSARSRQRVARVTPGVETRRHCGNAHEFNRARVHALQNLLQSRAWPVPGSQSRWYHSSGASGLIRPSMLLAAAARRVSRRRSTSGERIRRYDIMWSPSAVAGGEIHLGAANGESLREACPSNVSGRDGHRVPLRASRASTRGRAQEVRDLFGFFIEGSRNEIVRSHRRRPAWGNLAHPTSCRSTTEPVDRVSERRHGSRRTARAGA